MKITLIGCGKMGGAMAHGWLDAGIVAHIDIVEPHLHDDALRTSTLVTHYKDIDALDRTQDIVVLAVKPQMMGAVCAALKPHIHAQTLILSIAAGQSIASYETHFGAQQPIIRAMPNTPAAIGKGISVAVHNGYVRPAQKDAATILLQAVGLVEWIGDEGLMNAVTALSGSGPAYIFHLIEAMAQAGHAAGLDADFAMRLARQTVVGAAALAELSPETDAATLRQNVTSPGGTTEAGLRILMDAENGLKPLMENTVRAAKERGQALDG